MGAALEHVPQGGGIELAKPQSMLEVVMRAASDPSIDPARLKEFLQIGRELEADQARKEYNKAWAQMQPKLPVITKNGLIEYKPGTRPTQFAKWDDIHPACMPILQEFGFAVSFDSKNEDNKLTVIVKITHSSGHQECPQFTVPWLDSGGAKSPAQQAASAFTVAQRHAFCKAFNILTVGQDGNGSGRGQTEQITEDQARVLDDVIDACQQKESGFAARFAKWLKAELRADSIRDLFQGSQYDAVQQKLREKMAALGIR